MKGLEWLEVINNKKELFRLMNPQNRMLINSLTRINIMVYENTNNKYWIGLIM